MIPLLLVTALSAISFANDCSNCTPALKPFDGVIKNVEALQAPTVINCEETLKDNAKAEYQNLFGNLPKKQQKIKGINLEGSADELTYLNKMLSDKPTDQWSLARNCKTVLCAISKIYNSEETAERVLNIAKRDGYIVSVAKDFSNEKGPIGQLFTPEEIRGIDLAYKMLPHVYIKLNTLDRIKRLPKGYSSPKAPDAAAYASPGFHSKNYNLEGEITFLDGAFSRDEATGPYVAVHELSHHVDYSSSKNESLGLSESPAYLQMSGWKKKQSYDVDKTTGKKSLVIEWVHRADKKFVTNYAGTQPAEDFAENAAYYVFHPQELKRIDPEKYDFMKKNVFKGKEYVSAIELPASSAELLRTCINAKKDYPLYGDAIYFSLPLSSDCLNDYLKDLKITDPRLCSLNKEQIKNAMYDKISNSTAFLNAHLEKCNTDLPNLKKECMNDGNYQKNCPVTKYFSKNALSPSLLNLSDDQTKQLQENLLAKTHIESFGNRGNDVMKSIESKLGRNNFLSVVLISGLSNKEGIYVQYPLTRYGDFVKNANDGLAIKLANEGFQFDSDKDLAQMSQYYLMLDKGVSTSIDTFQETVLKKATNSKEENLALIKSWAASQSLEDTPLFEDLAETIRKYGGTKFSWK